MYAQADASQKLKKREAAVRKEDRRHQQSGPCRSQEADEEEKQQLQLQVGPLDTSLDVPCKKDLAERILTLTVVQPSSFWVCKSD